MKKNIFVIALLTLSFVAAVKARCSERIPGKIDVELRNFIEGSPSKCDALDDIAAELIRLL